MAELSLPTVLQSGVTVTWVDQCAGALGGGVLFLRQARTPQIAMMADTTAVAPQTESKTAQREVPPVSSDQVLSRFSSMHFGSAFGSQHPVAWHWNVSTPAIQKPRSQPYLTMLCRR